MISFLRFSLLFIAAFFAAEQAYAQVTIANVNFSSPATSCTNTSVTVSGSHFCANYINNGSSFTVTGNTINVTVSYSVGLICLPAIVPYTETINLGNLGSGTYTVNVTSLLNGNTSNTLNGNSLTVISCCDAVASFTTSNDSLCVGDTASFGSTAMNANSLTWVLDNNFLSNSVTNEILFDSAGTYEVALAVTGTGCVDTARQLIYVLDYPDANIGNDTTVCQGEMALFLATSGQGTYLWSTGNSSTSTTLSAPGTVSVTITNENGCESVGSASLLGFHPLPQPTISGDNPKCPDETVTYDAGAGYDTYLWFNTTTQQTLDWSLSGQVWVNVTDSNGCIGGDTVQISEFTIAPLVLSSDSDVCEITTLSTSSAFTSYEWSTGGVSATIQVNQSDTYAITVTDANGCEQFDEIDVTIFPNPVIDLGPDTNLCGVSAVVLSAITSGATYLWSDGSTGASLTVTQQGTYSVTVTSEDGCDGTDEVFVERCLGINNLGTEIVKVFPNPANDVIYVRIGEGPTTIEYLEIIDMQGRQVVRHENVSDAAGVDVSGLAKGYYSLRIQHRGSTAQLPLIIR